MTLTDSTSFIWTARRLARNPLGIIALFIALIYGFATLLLGAAAGKLDGGERLPIVWFVVLFPVLVLGAFYRLVTNHHGKLYAPADYKADASFLQTLSQQQVEERLTEEIEAAEQAPKPEHGKPTRQTRDAGARAESPRPVFDLAKIRSRHRQAEALAMKKLRKETGLAFEEQVSFGEGRLTAFDGVAEDGNNFVAAEVKLARVPNLHPLFVRDVLYRGVVASSILTKKTGNKRLRIILLLVLDENAEGEQEYFERLLVRQFEDAPVPAEFRIYRMKDLETEFAE